MKIAGWAGREECELALEATLDRMTRANRTHDDAAIASPDTFDESGLRRGWRAAWRERRGAHWRALRDSQVVPFWRSRGREVLEHDALGWVRTHTPSADTAAAFDAIIRDALKRDAHALILREAFDGAASMHAAFHRQRAEVGLGGDVTLVLWRNPRVPVTVQPAAPCSTHPPLAPRP